MAAGLAFDAAVAPALRRFAELGITNAALVASLDVWPIRTVIAQACEIDALRSEIRLLGGVLGADVSVLLLLAGTDCDVLRAVRARIARGEL